MRRAFSILELVVVIGLLGLFSGAAWNLMNGGVKQLATAGDHQGALRNALILTTALAQDFRAAAVLNQRREYQQSYPVTPQSVVLSPRHDSVRMRVSAPLTSLDADPASRFMIVTYQIVQKKDGWAAMQREERTASGKPLPGERTDRRTHTFEGITLVDVDFDFTVWLGPLEWKQYVSIKVIPTENYRGHPIYRSFEIAVPPPPHGSAGGPRGFALDFPPSALAGQLAGGFDLVGAPGNTEPLEVPPDWVDPSGKPSTEPAIVGPVPDPFVRLEVPAGPLRSQFLHSALDRLEGAVGASYRGWICGAISDDLRFSLDATDLCKSPLIQQLNLLIDRVKPKGPAAMAQLLYRMQLEAFPGSDKPVLEAARLLLDEPKGAAN